MRKHARPRLLSRRSPLPDTQIARSGLRAVGVLLVAVGGVFTVVGLVSFFSAFGGGGAPELFWCAFVGLPLLGIGTACLKAGYLGSIARYVASETAPVAADTVDYVARETRDTIRSVAGAITEGVRGHASSARECPSCRAAQRDDARFCDRCGTSLAAATCAKCRTALDAAASFCHACGSPTQD